MRSHISTPVRAASLLLTGALVATACSGGGSSDVESAGDTSAPTTAAPAVSEAPATTATPTTTVVLVPTSEAPTTTAAPTTLPPASGATLEAGQPATWFGVRDDSANNVSLVEERSSVDGTLEREFASYELADCIEENDEGECIIFGESWAPVSIDVTTDKVAVGLCCEPVSGSTQVLRRINGDLLSGTFGSEPAFAPTPPLMLTAVYADGGLYYVVNSNSGESTEIPIVPDWGDRATWSFDGSMIAVEVGDGIAIAFWDAALGEVVDVSITFEPPAGTTWSKPAFQASGNLVVVEDADAGGASKGVVLNKEVFGGLAGDLVFAEFPFEGTVVHQGYDETGTFLIYVLDDGSVRWQGKGQKGTLADPGSGHLAAAW